MINDSNELHKEQTKVLTAMGTVIKGTREIFRDEWEGAVRKNFKDNFDKAASMLFDAVGILQYTQEILKGNFELDQLLVEFFTYTTICDVIDENPELIHDLIFYYRDRNKIKTPMEDMKIVFYLTLNTVLTANLQKILDLCSDVVYNLHLPQDKDAFLMGIFIDDIFSYCRRFTHVHEDTKRLGCISFSKLNHKGIDCVDPVAVSYHIRDKKGQL